MTPDRRPKKPPYKIHGFVILARERDYGPDEVLLRACRKMIEAIEARRADAYQVEGTLGVPRDKTVTVTFVNEEMAWLLHQGAHVLAAIPEGKLLWCRSCGHVSPRPRCPDCGNMADIMDPPLGDGGIGGDGPDESWRGGPEGDEQP